MNNLIKNYIILAPKSLLPLVVKEQLIKANAIKGDFPKYLREIERIFCLDTLPPITIEQKLFIAGFVEGEGSINVSAKKLKTSKFGIVVDPEFSVTQHVNGVSQLHKALCIFQTGKIRYKSGSNATLIFTIDNRQSLVEKVIPFYEKYCKPHSSPAKIQRLNSFKKLLKFLDEKAHHNRILLRDEILPIWAEMRMQQGQSNQAFESLKDAQDFVTSIGL